MKEIHGFPREWKDDDVDFLLSTGQAELDHFALQILLPSNSNNSNNQQQQQQRHPQPHIGSQQQPVQQYNLPQQQQNIQQQQQQHNIPQNIPQHPQNIPQQPQNISQQQHNIPQEPRQQQTCPRNQTPVTPVTTASLVCPPSVEQPPVTAVTTRAAQEPPRGSIPLCHLPETHTSTSTTVQPTRASPGHCQHHHQREQQPGGQATQQPAAQITQQSAAHTTQLFESLLGVSPPPSPTYGRNQPQPQPTPVSVPTPAASDPTAAEPQEIMVTIDNVPYPIIPSPNAFEEIELPESMEQDLARLTQREAQCEYRTFL